MRSSKDDTHQKISDTSTFKLITDHSKTLNTWDKLTIEQKNKILESLLDDLNTVKMLSDIHTIGCWKELDDQILKLWLFDIQEQEIREIPHEVQQLADQRWQAKQDKNRSLADELRDKLKEYWWEMKDSKESYELTPLR